MTDSKIKIEYKCPDDCEDTWFCQDGTITATEVMDESGEVFETAHYDFTPYSEIAIGDGGLDGQIKCAKCRKPATVERFRETTTVTREPVEE